MGALASFATAGLDLLLSGAKQRAQEATSENTALHEVITSLYQAMQQVAQGYSNGSISQSQTLADLAQLKQSFWAAITPKIQPNRNGCNSGQNCPNANGDIYQGYCSGNIGASCCVGCNTIQKMFYDAANAVNKGSGTVITNAIAPSPKYGDPGFPAYTFVFSQPPQGVLQAVQQSAEEVISGNSGSGSIGSVPGLTFSSSNTMWYIVAAGIFLIGLLLAVRR